MFETGYISVIVPLKLEWEPVYALPEEAEGRHGEGGEDGRLRVGDLVKVRFAGKEYAAVVSGVGVSPTTSLDKVKPVTETLDLPGFPGEDIELWRKIAAYYMCTVGEVYKMVYQSVKMDAAIRKRAAAKSEASLDGNAERTSAGMEHPETGTEHRGAGTEHPETGTELPEASGQDADAPGIRLTTAQAKACEDVKAAFREGRPALLQGVTGSGKTEIYVRLAQETLSRGKNVLYLVPEIALSRQLEERLSGHFGGRVATWHSALTPSKKMDVLKTVEDRSRPHLVLGTRSALFLPHRELGLVIIDEEHDSSYKQDSPAPRYNGRDVALMLAALHRSDILLGSATPSFESLYNCSCGRFRRVFLSERFHGEGNTEVIVIDTNAERKKRGMLGSISRKLIELLKKNLESGGQAMILRERKSYATTVQCSECGGIIRCPHCNVSLNLQKSRGRLVCNHCGFVTAWTGHFLHLRPDNSKECDGHLNAFGAGTEKIEEELNGIFPERRIARLDSDTSAKAGWQKQVLKDFADRKIDILIGTQMLTKGFDFDNLNLVAVLQADSLLGQQDFRADEKALQLLEQFKGRCSRRGQDGVFVIQTAQPEHPVYRMLCGESGALPDGTGALPDGTESTAQTPASAGQAVQSQSIQGQGRQGQAVQGQSVHGQSVHGQSIHGQTAADYRLGLLEERRMFRYPPYTRIVNLVLKDPNPERLERFAGTLSLMLRGAGAVPGEGVEVTPPFAPAVDRINDEYLRIIRISLPKDRNLSANKAAIATILRNFSAERKYDSHITVDVDPV